VSLQGEAQTETGSPLRLATAMIFVPFPRFVFPTLRSPFCGCEARVDNCFTDIDCASLTEFARKGSHDARHHAGANPLLKSPMTGPERGYRSGRSARVHQSVIPTGHRSGWIGGSSKLALGDHAVLLVSGLADRGSSTVRPLGHVYGAFLC